MICDGHEGRRNVQEVIRATCGGHELIQEIIHATCEDRELVQDIIRATCEDRELVQDIIRAICGGQETHETAQEANGAIRGDRDIAKEMIVTDMGGP